MIEYCWRPNKKVMEERGCDAWSWTSEFILLSDDKVDYTPCPTDIPDGLWARELFIPGYPWS